MITKKDIPKEKKALIKNISKTLKKKYLRQKFSEILINKEIQIKQKNEISRILAKNDTANLQKYQFPSLKNPQKLTFSNLLNLNRFDSTINSTQNHIKNISELRPIIRIDSTQEKNPQSVQLTKEKQYPFTDRGNISNTVINFNIPGKETLQAHINQKGTQNYSDSNISPKQSRQNSFCYQNDEDESQALGKDYNILEDEDLKISIRNDLFEMERRFKRNENKKVK